MDISKPITGSSAWSGPQIASDPSWIHQLDEAEGEDIERAIRFAKRTGLSLRELTAEHYELPALAPAIGKWMRDLNHYE